MKITNEPLDVLTRVTDLMLAMCPEMRKGQCLFNALYKLYPEIANDIRGTDNDCFYDDSKISNLFKYLGN